MFLTTRRLILSPLRREDLSLTLWWRNVSRDAFATDRLLAPGEHEEWFGYIDGQRLRGPDEIWVARDKDALTPVGQISLYDFEFSDDFWIHKCAQLGRMVISPTERQRGYASEMVAALQRLARGLGLRFLYLYVKPNNVAAQRLYSVCGFDVVDGAEKDGMLRMEWRADG